MPSAAERRLFCGTAAAGDRARPGHQGGRRGAPARVPPACPVFGDWFQLRLVYNQGAAFGLHLGPFSRWFFLGSRRWRVFVLDTRCRARRTPGDRFRQLALRPGHRRGDRQPARPRPQCARRRRLLDFGLGAYRWPTFNVADIAVSCGALALAISLWIEDSRQARHEDRDGRLSTADGHARHASRCSPDAPSGSTDSSPTSSASPAPRPRASWRPAACACQGVVARASRPAQVSRGSRSSRCPTSSRRASCFPPTSRSPSSTRTSTSLVIDKPAGLVVHPAPGHWDDTLVNALVARGTQLSEGSAEGRPGHRAPARSRYFRA